MFDFPETVADVSAVPDQFRPYYNDKGVLRKEDPLVTGSVAAIMGLDKALKSARSDTDTIKKQLKSFEALSEFGKSPEDIVTGINERIKQAAEGSKLDIEKIKGSIQAANQQELDKRDGRIKVLTDYLYKTLVTETAVKAIAEAKGDTTLALPFVAKFVKVVENEGHGPAVVVVDETGNARYSRVNGGVPMTVQELVLEMKSDKLYARLFDSDSPNGSGSRNNGDTRPLGSNHGNKELSPRQRIRAGIEKQRQGRG